MRKEECVKLNQQKKTVVFHIKFVNRVEKHAFLRFIQFYFEIFNSSRP